MKKDLLIIAGPCAVESREQIIRIAKKLKSLGIEYLRGGAFKPRTNPNSFQGLGEEGIIYLLEAKRITGMKIVTEIMSIEQLHKYGEYIDIIQIGTRNMYNYDLLKEVGKMNKPVILKRGLSATYNEWLGAAEYIKKEGNKEVILCERGIRSFDNSTRNVLDIQAIPYIKENTTYKIIIDPSHASGHSYMINSMSLASITAGADGLIIEVHDKPEEALSDKEQTIDIQEFENILKKINILKEELLKNR
ncbi:MAG: 3-deoxy-7-phosphoheptulonate synthase [Bacilli bacterium]|nr:3-deoxy-7-phosphoheptulonate synthase [Bacilli bacterium]